jgi:hypothetical protein
MQALATKVADAEKGEPEGEEESSEAEEPESGEGGAEPGATPTVTLTPTLGLPMVSVSSNTNCRTGPGEVYDYRGALLVGEEALVTGKLADESFWYIENPDAPPPYCWIWGVYATVSGDKSSIAVLTPPPTPTPENTPTETPVPFSFIVSGKALIQCVSHVFVTGVKNTGGAAIESFWISVEHPNEGVTLELQQDFFSSGPSCLYTSIDSIPVGETRYIHVGGFTVPSGTYKVTVKVCSQEGLGGVCEQVYFEVNII